MPSFQRLGYLKLVSSFLISSTFRSHQGYRLHDIAYCKVTPTVFFFIQNNQLLAYISIPTFKMLNKAFWNLFRNCLRIMLWPIEPFRCFEWLLRVIWFLNHLSSVEMRYWFAGKDFKRWSKIFSSDSCPRIGGWIDSISPRKNRHLWSNNWSGWVALFISHHMHILTVTLPVKWFLTLFTEKLRNWIAETVSQKSLGHG